jgi:hypothetical protein
MIQPRQMMEVYVADAELLDDAVLDPYEMCSMNFARLEHDRLEQIVRQIIIPMVGGYESELGEALDRHCEQVRRFSGNFCWKHRHLGASAGEVDRGERA